MYVIVPTNNKGGVGKTKVCVLLAEYLSRYQHKRVLVIDFDPQCNLSQRFLKMEIDPASPEGLMPPIHPDYNPDNPDDQYWEGRSSIAGMFFKQPLIPYPTYCHDVDILPGHAEKLLLAEAVRRTEVAGKVHKLLNSFLQSPDVQASYDIAIVDTAPSKGPLTISAIRAATHLVIPAVMEEQPIQGVYGMLQLWMQESYRRTSDNPLNLLGILPNMFRQINLHKGMLESLQRSSRISKYVMPVKLGQRAVFAEVDVDEMTPATVFDLPDSNSAKMEALAVCEYITGKVFNNE